MNFSAVNSFHPLFNVSIGLIVKTSGRNENRGPVYYMLHTLNNMAVCVCVEGGEGGGGEGMFTCATLSPLLIRLFFPLFLYFDLI